MDAAAQQVHGDETERLVAPLSSRVIIALDHFSAAERVAVRAVVDAFARGTVRGTRLPDPDPFYLLRATPDVLVIVRRHTDGPVAIEEVVTQEKWDHLAHAS